MTLCREQKHVAIKILSAHATKLAESKQLAEIDICGTLQHESATSPPDPGLRYVVQPLDIFTFEGSAGKHFCVVTEPFAYSLSALFDVMGTKQLPLKRIMEWLKFTLLALRFLHDTCGIVHAGGRILALEEPTLTSLCTDIKPQNFLMKISELDKVISCELVTRPAAIYEIPKTMSISELGYCPVTSLPLPIAIDGDRQGFLFETVLSDLGHGHFDNQHLSQTVQPVALRAPEVALGLNWNRAIDIWSLGCLVSIVIIFKWANAYACHADV